LIVGILVLFIAAIVVFSKVATDHQQNQITIESEDETHTGKVNITPYTGRLRVYVVEPVSRWMMKNGEPYHFGFLGFAFNDNISIDPQDTFQKSITWKGDVIEENVMVIAVVSNSEQHQEYVSPPSDKPFKAYYTDATAAATPENTSYNTVTTNFTHTVFVEEVTTTWCPYCPSMGQALYAIYESGDYPWYFAALVYDMNSQAAYRRDEYNISGIPLAFFDGGYKVLQGEHSDETLYRPLIQACGTRQVPALNLSVSVTYSADGNLQIAIAITNENLPPSTELAPSGKINGS
jgi:thiol-disulfide isomerase/thioredoxin